MKNQEKNYYFEFWRNDGDWHTLDYDTSPTLVFKAENDNEALQLTYGYLTSNKLVGEEFFLISLYELKTDFKKRKIKFKGGEYSNYGFPRNFKIPFEYIKEKVNKTRFERLEDFIKKWQND